MPLVSLNEDRLQKPMRKLRKMLKKLPQSPTPDQVHDLRTRTRRLEANVQALRLDTNGTGRRLVKALKPIRKRAGKVRDLDVFAGLASGLHGQADESCLVELLEHLGASRQQQAGKLHKMVRNNGNKTRKLLKRSSRLIAKSIDNGGRISGNAHSWPADTVSESLEIEDELREWPRLTSANLHPFRLKIKELRYVLQLDKDADPELIKNLGQVKDAIGEWHDWLELAAIAEDTLDHGAECRLMKLIRATTRAKFSSAVTIAEKARRNYLQAPGPRLLHHAA